MEITFKIIAAALVMAALYFFWDGNTDGGFVSAVLGAVSYLLSLRFQIKARINERTAAESKTVDDQP